MLSTGPTRVAKFNYARRLDVPAQTTATLAGRKWLPGGSTPGSKFPEYVASPRENFPAVYTVASPAEEHSGSVSDFAKDAREIIERELHIHGAILFRGVPIQTGGGEFSQFMSGLGYTLMDYGSGGTAFRHKVAKNVATASDQAAELSIELHNEKAYVENPPRKVFFFCDVPALPGNGGETAIADVRDVLPKLDPELVEKVRRLGIRYCRHLPTKKPGGYTSWQESFSTEEKSDVEKYMAEHGRDYRWEEDGALTYWHNQPGFGTHPKTGEEVWFNQFHAQHASFFKDHPKWAHLDIPNDKCPFHCYYGDGSEIEAEAIQHVREVFWEVSVGFQMQKGDILAMDNIYVSHARLGFTGDRRLLASFSED